MSSLLILFKAQTTWSDEYRPLFRSTRAQGMGNAFTAVADDETAVFYNPAALSGIEKFTFKLVSTEFDISNDFLAEYPQINALIANPSLSTLNSLMGKNIYNRGQASFTVAVPGLGFSVFVDQQSVIRLKNPSFPQVTFAGQTTYGGQVGVGFRVARFKKRKGEVRFGVAGKVLWRGGGYQHPSLTQFLTLNTASMTSNLTNFGIGFGADTGVHVVYNANKKLSLSTALVYKDMGNTAFSSPADAQTANLAFGVAARIKSRDMIATIAYDYDNIFDGADFRKKMHFGLELKFPFLSLYGGLNQLYVCYGAGIDLWMFRVMYVSYAEELTTIGGLDSERRHLAHFSLKFDL